MPVISNNSKKVVEERKSVNFKLNNEFIKTLVINFMVCFLASYMAISIVFNSRFPRPPRMPKRGLFNQEQQFPPQEEILRRRQEMIQRERNMTPPQTGMSPTAYPARKINNDKRQLPAAVQYPQQMPPAVQYPQQPPMNPNANVQYGPINNQ